MSVLRQLRGGQGFHIDRRVTYWQCNDLSVTYGGIFDAIRKWIKNDLKGVVDFKHEFVNTQLQSDKDFFWNTGVLAQARKPLLNLAFEVDHTHVHQGYENNTFRNTEGMNYLDERGSMYRIFAFEDEKDPTNNLEIRIAFKNAHIATNSGIVVTSRPAANNIAQYWMTKRNDDFRYSFNMMVDYKIPPELINYLGEKFNINTKNHHTMLRFLNQNAFVRCYWGMSGYDGQMYYFIRYPSQSIIAAGSMSNPTAWDTKGYNNPETYTIERPFELDIMVPMYLAFSTYGDRVLLEDDKYKDDETWRDSDLNTAATRIHERYIEVERVFKYRHLLKEVAFTWDKDDLITHPSGTVTTKKISLLPFLDLEHDQYLSEFLEWCKAKGYTNANVFNFQMYQEPGIGIKNAITRPNVLRESIEHFEDNMEKVTIPNDNEEYLYYIKNMSEFTIVDLKPDTTRELYGQIYLDLAKVNEYEQETGNSLHKPFSNDDMGHDTGYGRSHLEQTQNRY